ncbi:MAG: 16S rRNA (adenine(1518)-N(6)/adenine(1519)-N(6))-dimethyltransferase RsmA [Butyricicoccus pullicaecorum]|nr:16S rRNA (adenine(1518)-N(6)/adenine(1519)-N(6))-dimethyltransferase RsmA [Butyricicoccus pullicaecorum]
MGLCDIQEIKAILARHGFHFSKSLGQNFLTEQWVPNQIAESCGVDTASCVLEVGPGMGCLTVELSKRAEKVVSIEIDRTLFPVLSETLADCPNTEIVEGDVLKIDLKALCTQKFSGRTVYACANLPYYITTPAIAALLDSGAFAGITIMVQKEVAERICAPAGIGDASAFSIYIQYHAKAEYLFDVPRDCFVPQPKVDSAVIRLTPLPEPAVSVSNENLFFDIVHAAFNQRRKTLVNAMGSLFRSKLNKEELTKLVTDCGLDARIRGERLTLSDYAKLTDAVDVYMHQYGSDTE